MPHSEDQACGCGPGEVYASVMEPLYRGLRFAATASAFMFLAALLTALEFGHCRELDWGLSVMFALSLLLLNSASGKVRDAQRLGFYCEKN